jgi:hypothetical protein
VARRKFNKIATFEVPGRGEGSVRLAETGEVRFELPGRFSIESFFPGWKTGDAMNITFVPSSSDPEDDEST